VGNGGEPMDASEDFGFFVTMLPVADVYGKLFSWWLGEGHRGGTEDL
jgi:hypothetical protein